VNDRLALFVADAKRHPNFGPSLKQVLNTPLRGWAWVDAAVVGGDVRLRQLLDDRVDAAQIPEGLHEAYAAQYPVKSESTSLVEFLREHADDPQALRGALNGIKGKYFEMRYAEHLNAGNLPDGHTALLADSPTNAGWDIQVVDESGQTVEWINTKVNASLNVVQEHLDRYPGIDIVTTSEAADQVIAAGIDGIEVSAFWSNESLNEVADGAVTAVTDGLDGILGLPLLAIGFMSATAYRRLKAGQAPVEVARLLGKRLIVLGIAGGAASALVALSGEPIVGAPTAATVYLVVGRLTHLGSAADNVAGMRKELQHLALSPPA
jgi:hypothetical protein